MEFNYLGVNITSLGNLAKEIKIQAQKAASVAVCLNDPLWRNKYVRKITKSRLYIYIYTPRLQSRLIMKVTVPRTCTLQIKQAYHLVHTHEQKSVIGKRFLTQHLVSSHMISTNQ